MLVDCPSPVGVIIKGTGLLFGAIVVGVENKFVSAYIKSLKLLHKPWQSL